jgi:3-deoxy-D-manno-octulosonate 8-phosphate phosphatase (KDO 8-P phosphatase)
MRVKNLVLDVDGVLTNGLYHLSMNGEVTKSFHCRDYDAIHRLQKKGVNVHLLSCSSICLQEYANTVGCYSTYVDYDQTKLEQLNCIFSKEELQHTLYCGDTIQDLECLRACAYQCVPKGCELELQKNISDLTVEHLNTKGGEGVVEEIEGIINNLNGNDSSITTMPGSVDLDAVVRKFSHPLIIQSLSKNEGGGFHISIQDSPINSVGDTVLEALRILSEICNEATLYYLEKGISPENIKMKY